MKHLWLLAMLSACSEVPPMPTPLHPATEAGIRVGRRLFYDVRLSGEGHVACATCHDPARAFTDGEALSTRGASHRPLMRNTPTLINIAWAPALFWDGGAKNLESLSMGPIQSVHEMNQTMAAIVGTLTADPSYVEDFKRAFADGITPANILRALAQYERSLVAFDSRYDAGVLTKQERVGQAVYQTHCQSCHATDLFTDESFHNNGIDASCAYTGIDPRRGRARITGDDADCGKYRTPTLRNLAYTAPYMHDGRYATLREVIAHYRKTMPMHDDEAQALLAFLEALNGNMLTKR